MDRSLRRSNQKIIAKKPHSVLIKIHNYYSGHSFYWNIDYGGWKSIQREVEKTCTLWINFMAPSHRVSPQLPETRPHANSSKLLYTPFCFQNYAIYPFHSPAGRPWRCTGHFTAVHLYITANEWGRWKKKTFCSFGCFVWLSFFCSFATVAPKCVLASRQNLFSNMHCVRECSEFCMCHMSPGFLIVIFNYLFSVKLL